MPEIKFKYRNRQSKAINLKLPLEEIEKFETDYKNKIVEKYQDTLVSPTVEIVVSDNGAKILDVHLLVD
jgi:hypothetical protein